MTEHVLAEYRLVTVAIEYAPQVEPGILITYRGWEGRGVPQLLACYGLDTGDLVDGWLPPDAVRSLRRWARRHDKLLRQAWEDGRQGIVPTRVDIDPTTEHAEARAEAPDA